MNLKRYLLEEIDPEVKKIKKGDEVKFYKGKHKGASDFLYHGIVTKVSKSHITIKSKSGEIYVTAKTEMVMDQ
jgi:ribosomal protein L24